jgi:Uma2 family endonuclease
VAEPARRLITVEEYLAWEERAQTRSEYFDGEVFAMAGGSPEHNLICGNLIRELGNQLDERPCRVYPSDQRVKIPSTGLYTYPDVAVVCGEPEYEARERRALLNPTLIIEVLSESTEAYDRGAKFAHYQRLPSLREYVLVASEARRMERFTRLDGEDAWSMAACDSPAGVLPLLSIQGTLSVPRVYQKVDFPTQAPGRRRGPRA